MRRAALPPLLVAFVLTATFATAAEGATTRSVCTATALRDSPYGFVIGRLDRRQRVTVKLRGQDRRWSLVVTRHGTVGWLPSKSLCRA